MKVNLRLLFFLFCELQRRSLEETAEEIGRDLVENFEAAVAFQVVKGFLNISLSDKRWLKFLNDFDGRSKTWSQAKRQQTDYGGVLFTEYQ